METRLKLVLHCRPYHRLTHIRTHAPAPIRVHSFQISRIYKYETASPIICRQHHWPTVQWQRQRTMPKIYRNTFQIYRCWTVAEKCLRNFRLAVGRPGLMCAISHVTVHFVCLQHRRHRFRLVSLFVLKHFSFCKQMVQRARTSTLSIGK